MPAYTRISVQAHEPIAISVLTDAENLSGLRLKSSGIILAIIRWLVTKSNSASDYLFRNARLVGWPA